MRRRRDPDAERMRYATERAAKVHVRRYTTRLEKKARRGAPRLPAGSKVYILEYKPCPGWMLPRRYYTTCYTDFWSACTVAHRLTGTLQEIDFNSVTDPEHARHYVREVG